MYSHSLSFVIPAYNEEANIERIVDSAYLFLSQNFERFEILLIDDGSTDNTHAVCNQLALKYGEKVIVLRHSQNRGYGAALRSGLFGAENDLIFYTDADNQFELSELKDFMNYIDDFDLVIGYRKDRKDAMIRKLSSRVFNRLIFLIFGLNIKDIDCSFKLFKKSALQSLSIERDEFLVDTELLVKAKLKNLRIKELPVTHHPRTFGRSTVKFRHIFSTIKDILFLKNRLKLK